MGEWVKMVKLIQVFSHKNCQCFKFCWLDERSYYKKRAKSFSINADHLFRFTKEGILTKQRSFVTKYKFSNWRGRASDIAEPFKSVKTNKDQKNEKKVKKVSWKKCISRESNPGLILERRDKCCHYTTDASYYLFK
jgi:hypothetical protein